MAPNSFDVCFAFAFFRRLFSFLGDLAIFMYNGLSPARIPFMITINRMLGSYYPPFLGMPTRTTMCMKIAMLAFRSFNASFYVDRTASNDEARLVKLVNQTPQHPRRSSACYVTQSMIPCS